MCLAVDSFCYTPQNLCLRGMIAFHLEQDLLTLGSWNTVLPTVCVGFGAVGDGEDAPARGNIMQKCERTRGLPRSLWDARAHT